MDLLEKNSPAVPLSGGFLWNRVLWLGLALIVLWRVYKRFKMILAEGKRPGQKVKRNQEKKDINGSGLFLSHPLLLEVRLHLRAIMGQKSFWIIGALGFAWILLTGGFNVGIQRSLTQAYPVTSLLLESISFPLFTTVLFLICTMAGFLIWFDRDCQSQELIDALPVSDWRLLFPRLLAMWSVLLATVLLTGGLGVLIQVFKGYSRFEIGLAAAELLGRQFPMFCIMATMAFFLQVALNHRWPAYILFLLLADEGMELLGFKHHLILFAKAPPVTLSDMNGLGPFWQGILHYTLYWGLFAWVLIGLSLLLWVRGHEQGLGNRLRIMAGRFSGRVRVFMILGLLSWLGSGAYITYETLMVNRYEPEGVVLGKQVRYEQRWREWGERIQPIITAVSLQVDLYPEQRRVSSRGHLNLQNQSSQAIAEVFVQMPQAPQTVEYALDRAGKVLEEDPQTRVNIFHLDTPLRPGEQCRLNFTLHWQESGFKDQGEETRLMPNGTFLTNQHLVPAIGYDSDYQRELTGQERRRRFGLGPQTLWPDAESPGVREHNLLNRHAHRIDFEARISTSADQTALTIGDLIASRQENGRNYYHYRCAKPIWYYFPVLSGRYEVKSIPWQGRQISVYHHPGHPWNVDLMLQAARDSLEVFSQEFSPYAYSHLRIVEFPRYEVFAEGFPGLIPFSEGHEFIAHYPGQERVEGVYRVVAHELAHQWWAHQILGARAKGLFMMTESLAQYGAFMLVKRRYLPQAERLYASQEAGLYFRGRGQGDVLETPLNQVIDSNDVLSYQKGYGVMRALAGYLGEDTVNQALRDYLRIWAEKEPPYALAEDFLLALQQVTPLSHRYLLDDWFRSIIIYDCRAKEAHVSRTADGRYLMRLAYTFIKKRCDAQGREESVTPSDWVFFAVYDKSGKLLKREQVQLKAEEGVYTVQLDEQPDAVAIDPDGFLLDRNDKDNFMVVRYIKD